MKSKLALRVDDDAVLHEASTNAGESVVVTRGVAGFASFDLPTFTPSELIAWFNGP